MWKTMQNLRQWQKVGIFIRSIGLIRGVFGTNHWMLEHVRNIGLLLLSCSVFRNIRSGRQCTIRTVKLRAGGMWLLVRPKTRELDARWRSKLVQPLERLEILTHRRYEFSGVLGNNAATRHGRPSQSLQPGFGGMKGKNPVPKSRQPQ
jgi:hypothetical protein